MLYHCVYGSHASRVLAAATYGLANCCLCMRTYTTGDQTVVDVHELVQHMHSPGILVGSGTCCMFEQC